jgi:hypothetical protein
MEQVLASQPDHLTWVTQDVFALSIVVMEWLTFGMFTYPYNREVSSQRVCVRECVLCVFLCESVFHLQ